LIMAGSPKHSPVLHEQYSISNKKVHNCMLSVANHLGFSVLDHKIIRRSQRALS
jgi:hypothetical protein